MIKKTVWCALWVSIAGTGMAQMRPPIDVTTQQANTEVDIGNATSMDLDAMFGLNEKGYRPRSSHPVALEDISACPEGGGMPALMRGIGAPHATKGGEMVIDIQADMAALSVSFAHNSNSLDREARAGLEKMLPYLKNPLLARKKILIEGHASRVGSKAANYRISCERAAVVRGYFREGGIDVERLFLMGKGFDAPDPVLSAERQRRVTLRVIE